MTTYQVAVTTAHPQVNVEADQHTAQVTGAGPQGPPGANGVGVPAGGAANQVLAKNTATDYDTGWATTPQLPPHTLSPAGYTNAVVTTVANTTLHYRCLGAGTISTFQMSCLTSAGGNIAVAVYASAGGSGPPTTRQQTSGSLPAPAVGNAFVNLGGSVAVNQNNYLSIGADVASWQARGNAYVGATGSVSTMPGFSYQDPGFPPPATAAPNSTRMGGVIVIVGV
jgi:hypothetical protein